MVGRFVEQQQVGGFKQQLAQRHATALTTGAHGNRGVRVRTLQCVHGLLELGIDVPAVGRVDLVLELAHFLHQRVEVRVRIGHLLADLVEAFHLRGDFAECQSDVLADGLGVVQRRLLLQDADGVAGGQGGFAVGDGVEAGHDFQQRGLAHAVRADDADLRARQEAQGHVVEDHAVAVGLASLDHLVNEFSQCCVPSLRNVGIPAFCVSQSTEFHLWAVEEDASWRLWRRTKRESAYVDENPVFSGPILAQSTIRDYPIPRRHAATGRWCLIKSGSGLSWRMSVNRFLLPCRRTAVFRAPLTKLL